MSIDMMQLATITVHEINRVKGLREKILELGEEKSGDLIESAMISAVDRFQEFATECRTNEKLGQYVCKIVLEAL